MSPQAVRYALGVGYRADLRLGAASLAILAFLPGREAEARAAIEAAVHWGAALGVRHLHVMAGRAGGAVGMGPAISSQATCRLRSRLAGSGSSG